jgi:U3 small nucleolar RNA-associated protein 23
MIFIDLSIHLQVPGVPVIFALRNSLFLEPPSSFQRQFVKTSEEERMHMTEREYRMLQKTRSADEEANDSSSEKEDVVDQNIGIQDLAKPRTARKGVNVKDKVQFKRKKAKVVLYTRIFLILILFFFFFFIYFYLFIYFFKKCYL